MMVSHDHHECLNLCLNKKYPKITQIKEVFLSIENAATSQIS